MCFHVSVVVVYTNTVAHAILVLITIAVWAVVAHVVVCSWFGLFVLLLVVVCVFVWVTVLIAHPGLQFVRKCFARDGWAIQGLP